MGAVCLLFACGNPGNTANESAQADSNVVTDSDQEQWVSLQDLNQWHTYGKDSAGTAWEVTPDGIHMNPTIEDNAQRGDLVSNESYENFHLKLEWKVAPGGNSGIIFLVQDDPQTYPATYSTGPEMQVLDNERHPDAKIDKHRAGDLYDLIAVSEEHVNPAGSWNAAEIKVLDNHLEFYFNGKKVVETTMHDQAWKTMIAGSKFASMPGFGSFSSGKIALQDHGDEVWFRNIQIRRL